MKNERFSILLKKLNKLEHLVNNKFFSVQPDDPSLQPEIEQRLTFVKNLLSAEFSSSPTKPYDLKNMSERVRELEATFCGVATGSGTTTSTIDHVDNVGDDEDDEDRASKCSACTKSNQDEEDDDNVSDDLESTLGQDTGVIVDLVEENKATPVRVFNNVLFEDKVDDDRVIEDNGASVEEEDFRNRLEDVFDVMSHNGVSVEDGKEEKEIIRADVNLKEREKKEKGLGFGKLCGVGMTGFLIGMFSMAWLVIDSLEYHGYEGHGYSLTPT